MKNKIVFLLLSTIVLIGLGSCTSPAKRYVQKIVENGREIYNYQEGEVIINHDASVLYIKYGASSDFLRVSAEVNQKLRFILGNYKYNTLTFLYKEQEDAERKYNIILDKMNPSYDRRIHGWKQLVSYEVEGIHKSYYVYYGYRQDYYTRDHMKVLDDSKVLTTEPSIRRASVQISSEIDYSLAGIERAIKNYTYKKNNYVGRRNL
jgi:hypothetical protein